MSAFQSQQPKYEYQENKTRVPVAPVVVKPSLEVTEEAFPALGSPKQSGKSSAESPKHSFAELVRRRKAEEEIEEKARQLKYVEEAERRKKKQEERDIHKHLHANSYSLGSLKRYSSDVQDPVSDDDFDEV